MLRQFFDFLFDRDLDRGPTREELQDLANKTPNEVIRLARSGKKLEAIKLYREVSGESLRRSKAVVDWFAP